MQTKYPLALAAGALLLAGSAGVPAQDATATALQSREQVRLQSPDHDTLYGQQHELDQRNRIWSMQGVREGSYTGEAERKAIRTRTREREREMTQDSRGQGYGSRYGRGYESRQGGGFGSPTGASGGGRSAAAGGGGRR